MSVSVKVDINKAKVQKRIFSDEAKLFLASTAYKLMFDYIPADTLTLASTVRMNGSKMPEQSAINRGLNSGNIKLEKDYAVIVFNAPYAHKIYNGRHMNFRKDTHPLATAKWEKAMLNARGEKLAQTMQNYYTGGPLL